MKLNIPILAVAFAAVLTTAPAWTQAPPAGRDHSFLTNAEISTGAFGQFTPVLPTNNASVPQKTTDSVGGLVSIAVHPVAWAGVQVNYGFSEFTEGFRSPVSYYRVKTVMNEVSAAYIVHPHFRNFQPFIGIGGGYIGFVPVVGPDQGRGEGLVEAGFDIPTSNPHFGFRVQGRSLIYRAPNYYNGAVGTVNWVATTEPMAGVWYRR